jgi:peptidoglycan-N-acetylglucosamine deacetylase
VSSAPQDPAAGGSPPGVTRRRLLAGAGATAAVLALEGCARTGPGAGGEDQAAPFGGLTRVGAQRVIWSTRPDRPLAALTFDDGPTPEYTPRVLDALAKAGVRATFDVMGVNAVRHPDLLREIVARGHRLADHTWSHLDQVGMRPAEIRSEIVRCKEEVEQLVQRPLVGYRPPRGDLTGYALRVCAELGYDVLMWSCTRGPAGTSTVQAVTDYLGSTVQPGDIVVLHDGLGRGTFAPGSSGTRALADRREVEVLALPEALRRIADRGVTLTTVPDLLARSVT